MHLKGGQDIILVLDVTCSSDGMSLYFPIAFGKRRKGLLRCWFSSKIASQAFEQFDFACQNTFCVQSRFGDIVYPVGNAVKI